MSAPIALLRRVPLFSGLAEGELTSIAALAQRRRYEARAVVVQQSDPSHELFVIITGHLRVLTVGAEGRDTALGIMGPGEVFGEVSLLDGGPRSATIAALDSAELLVLRREHFFRFLETSPKTAIELLRVLAGRLRRLTERSEDIAFLRVSGRLAKRLVGLANQYGEKLPDGTVRLPFKLSQQEIGEFVGATRESANKQLRAWEQDALVSHQNGHLLFHDLEALAEQGGDE